MLAWIGCASQVRNAAEPVPTGVVTPSPTYTIETPIPPATAPVILETPAPTVRLLARTTGQPIPTPLPAAELCGAPSNPWGYNFCGRGGYITAPPSDFCSYFGCIANFPNGVGYVIECADHMYSKSGGRQGSCSHHGGNNRVLYSGT
jgi:hypothetical protein